MAVRHARDVYTRRNEGVSIWVVRVRRDHRVEPRREGPAVRAERRQGLPPPDVLRHPRQRSPHVTHPTESFVPPLRSSTNDSADPRNVITHPTRATCPTHDSVYDGLLGSDDSQWAFGTDFEDPLAGVDTTVPDGVDTHELAAYCLMLGRRRPRDVAPAVAVVQQRARPRGGHRAGQHRARPARPGAAAAGARRRCRSRRSYRRCPRARRCRRRTRWRSSASDREFRNVRLVEADNGDFAVTIVRLLLFSTWRLALLRAARAPAATTCCRPSPPRASRR